LEEPPVGRSNPLGYAGGRYPRAEEISLLLLAVEQSSRLFVVMYTERDMYLSYVLLEVRHGEYPG